ncbi:MAG: 3-methylornithine--L-lysine ligase PylC [Gracilibacteraceae bacterium]|jgi:pyrrolysine biosynthesis protein PylC|nr:3-methylornithine--L-lysine ligase PylC [Gracilibacteraceae bacterium]
MRLLIAGGRLQAVEAVYLAKKLGWETVVLDRRPGAEAAGMGDEFYCCAAEDEDTVLPVVKSADAVLPALENLPALLRLEGYCRRAGTPFLFDTRAYRLSSSKLRSDAFFRKNGVPAPRYYPAAGFPLVLKPDGQSGSAGVRVIRGPAELDLRAAAGWVLQEYLAGRSYSLEVVGDGRRFELLQVTEIITDREHDCKCVLAGDGIPADVAREFAALGQKLGELIRIRGVFDIEVIAAEGGLRVLEIDARLPSQTPVCVYHSRGVNILERMYAWLVKAQAEPPAAPGAVKAAMYKQIHVAGTGVVSRGERILTGRGPLRIQEGLFGADCMITDHAPSKEEWVAAVIVTGRTRAAAAEKFRGVIKRIGCGPCEEG